GSGVLDRAASSRAFAINSRIAWVISQPSRTLSMLRSKSPAVCARSVRSVIASVRSLLRLPVSPANSAALALNRSRSFRISEPDGLAARRALEGLQRLFTRVDQFDRFSANQIERVGGTV